MTTEICMWWYELPPMPQGLDDLHGFLPAAELAEWLATVKQANGCQVTALLGAICSKGGTMELRTLDEPFKTLLEQWAQRHGIALFPTTPENDESEEEIETCILRMPGEGLYDLEAWGHNVAVCQGCPFACPASH